MRRIPSVLYLWVALVVLVVAGSVMASSAMAAGEPPSQTIINYGRVQVAPTAGVEAVFWHAMRMARCFYWTLIVCHVLLALWVLLDIRKRKEGNPIFVLLVLFAGFPAAVVYAITRIGDRKV